MIKGNDIIIYEDGVAVLASRSCDVQTETEAREVSSPYSGKWRDYRDGRSGWAVNLNRLVGNVVDNILHNGKRVHMVIGKRDENGLLTDDYVEGDALCTMAKCTATRGNMAAGSWSFIGCGPLLPYIMNLRDVNGMNLRTSDGEQLRVHGF